MTVAEEIVPTPAPRTGPIWVVAFAGLVVCTNVAAASWVTMDDEHPASLLLLSSRNRFLVATVPSGISPLEWAVLATLRLGAAAIVCHMLGRAYGDRALRWFWKFLGMPAEQVTKFETAFARAEWAVIPFFVGSNIVWVLSGAAKTTWKRLVPLAAIGLAGRLALLWWLSKEFESEVRSTLRWLDRYQWYVLGASIVIVVVANVRNFRGK
ncbi:MAG: hypothetical protein WCK21_07695 [Actinomycetota bacterium]